jgi:HEAT repeat protein
MHLSHGASRPLLLLCLACAATSGCTWGSKNGVPWWGSKEEKSAAAENLKRYGPFAFERIEIVKQLGEYAAKGGPEEKEKVAQRLASDIQREQDPLVRMQMVRTLAGIPNETASAVLVAGAKDPDPEVRVAVCQSWGKRLTASGKAAAPAGDIATASKILGDSLSGDTNIDVRLAAATALGKVKDPRTVGTLAIALKDPDPALQFEAVASLKQVSGKDFGNDVSKWQQYAASVAPPAESPSVVAGHGQNVQ